MNTRFVLGKFVQFLEVRFQVNRCIFHCGRSAMHFLLRLCGRNMQHYTCSSTSMCVYLVCTGHDECVDMVD